MVEGRAVQKDYGKEFSKVVSTAACMAVGLDGGSVVQLVAVLVA